MDGSVVATKSTMGKAYWKNNKKGLTVLKTKIYNIYTVFVSPSVVMLYVEAKIQQNIL